MRSDESPGVCGQARRALEAQATTAGAERLAVIFAQTPHRHVRLQTLALINVLPKWDALPLLIRIHGDQNDLVRGSAASHLSSWLAGFNRTHWVQPSTTDLTRFREALDIFSAILPKDMAGAPRRGKFTPRDPIIRTVWQMDGYRWALAFLEPRRCSLSITHIFWLPSAGSGGAQSL